MESREKSNLDQELAEAIIMCADDLAVQMAEFNQYVNPDSPYTKLSFEDQKKWMRFSLERYTKVLKDDWDPSESVKACPAINLLNTPTVGSMVPAEAIRGQLVMGRLMVPYIQAVFSNEPARLELAMSRFEFTIREAVRVNLRELETRVDQDIDNLAHEGIRDVHSIMNESRSADDRTPWVSLPKDISDREQEVLRRIALGYENGEIAADLCITINTVKNHVRSLLRKCGLNNRTQLGLLAASVGLVSPGEISKTLASYSGQ